MENLRHSATTYVATFTDVLHSEMEDEDVNDWYAEAGLSKGGVINNRQGGYALTCLESHGNLLRSAICHNQPADVIRGHIVEMGKLLVKIAAVRGEL